jgi:hypothetical protein
MSSTTLQLLKAKTTIQCDCCGSSMARTKSFEVEATEKEVAKIEVREKVAKWQASLKGQNCQVCQSIIDSI